MGRTERMVMGDGAEIAVYHASPPAEDGDARIGGLVVVQEIFGLTDGIRAVADGFAADGFEVLAPALFDREAPGFQAGHDAAGIARGVELARELHPFEQSVADVGTCIDALAPRGPVFVVGYCYGGSVAWYAAARGTGLAAAACYYGAQVPHAEAEPRVPTIAHFGRHDRGIPVEGVEALIARAPRHTEVHLYDAGHGFASDRRADYDPQAAALARERTLALFRAHAQ